MKRKTRVWQAVAAFIGATVAATSAADSGRRAWIVEPGQEFLNNSYNGLVSEWANWLAIEPSATNPAFDPDGGFCDKNQRGRVWFLAGTFLDGVVDRTCRIPYGKAIFVSVGGAFVSFKPEFPSVNDPCLTLSKPIDQVRCDVNDDVPPAPKVSFEVELNGVKIEDLYAFRTQSEPGGFVFRIKEDSLFTDFGLPPGDRAPAVADGYFLFVKPLNPGRHSLKVRQTDQTGIRGVNYNLVVR